jgi:arylsulfatase
VHEGSLKYAYTFLGVQHTTVGATSRLPAGKHQVRMEFSYEGGGIGKGAAIALFVDGKAVGQGKLKRTHALFYSMDETLEVGCDMGEPVSEEYGHGHENRFNGRIDWVRIDVDAAAKDADHMIGAEERFMAAMARQ